MVMNNIASIVIPYINTEPILSALKSRAEALAGQMNPEAGSQFASDMQSIDCNVQDQGENISFAPQISESYIVNYLASHDTPVAGGDNGTAHNVDGSTYQSNVPKKFWGTPLPFLELPIIDALNEAIQIVRLLAPDAVKDAISNSKEKILEVIKPQIIQEFTTALGGA